MSVFYKMYNQARKKWEGIFANGLMTNDDKHKYTAEYFHEYHTNGEVVKARRNIHGVDYQDIAKRLIALDEELEAEGVSVKKFGAKGDGKTNDTCAFQDAFDAGYKWIKVPQGTYIVDGLDIPSDVKLTGAGLGTIIKLNPAREFSKNNVIQVWSKRRVIIRDMQIDGSNLKDFNKEIGEAPRSNGVAVVDSRYVWVQNVHTKDTGKHGFDMSSPMYHGTPDNSTTYAPNGSKYVWFDNCTATTYGDDGFTTHFSEYGFFTNCHAHTPSTTIFNVGAGNNNGFEADDGSRHMWFIQCHSRRNCRGFEVKGHSTRPSAQNVHLVGCVSEEDIRSFDFRHIGHHSASNPISKSAFNITVTDCTAKHPIWNKPIYDLSPRALTVSAFRNVSISNFTAIGNTSYNYDGMSGVVVMQFKARNVSLNGVNISGFRNAGADIRITGGEQYADNINLSNVNIFESSRNFGIYTGGRMNNIHISHVNMMGDGNNNIGISTFNSRAQISSIKADGYKTKASIGGQNYKDFVPNSFAGGTRISAYAQKALHAVSTVIASTGGSIASASKSVVMASSNGHATAERSAVISSSANSKARGDKTAVIASSGGEASAQRSVVIGSATNSRASGDQSAVIASHDSRATGARSIVIGSSTGSTATGDKSLVASSSGNAKATGVRSAVIGTASASSATGDQTFVGASSDSHAKNVRSTVLASSTGSTASGNKSVILGSSSATASGEASAVIATTAGSKATGGKSAVLASSSGLATGDRTAVIATSTNSTAKGNRTAVIASSSGVAGGESSAVIATTGGSTAEGERTLVASSSGGSSAKGSRGTILSSDNSHIPADSIAKTILSSRGVILEDNYRVAGGYGADGASASNKRWEISSMSGNAKFAKIEGSMTDSDFGEYFESASGEAIPSGYIVSLEKGKIRLANEKDKNFKGVISETAGLILGEASFHWQGRFLTNEFGGLRYKTIIDDETNEEIQVPIPNPDFDETAEYKSRADRKEWNIVGLTGQVHVRIDETVKVDDIVMSNKNGIATKDKVSETGWQIMSITTPFNEEKGYGIAKVLIK